MKHTSFLSIIPRTVIGLAVALAAGHVFADNSPLDSADKSFLENAHTDGLAEVKMAQDAGSRSSNADVKAFAEKMVTDHTKADSDLKTLADSKKVSLASEPTLTERTKGKLLDTHKGAKFDKDYIDDAVTDHKKAVADFEKAANEAKDPDVKAFASKTLPTLREHLTMAEQLQSKLGK